MSFFLEPRNAGPSDRQVPFLVPKISTQNEKERCGGGRCCEQRASSTRRKVWKWTKTFWRNIHNYVVNAWFFFAILGIFWRLLLSIEWTFQTRSNFLLSIFGSKTVFFCPTLIKKSFRSWMALMMKMILFCESANTRPKNGLRAFLGLLRGCQPLSFCSNYSLLFDAILFGWFRCWGWCWSLRWCWCWLRDLRSCCKTCVDCWYP